MTLRTLTGCLALALVMSTAPHALAELVAFTLLTHPDFSGKLPQQAGVENVTGDHLIGTADDWPSASLNPDGCFSFNFMVPAGFDPGEGYPDGYAEGIHSMTGSFVLDVDLAAGGAFSMTDLAFDGCRSATKSSYQCLVKPGDEATGADYGAVANGGPNSGAYAASAEGDWAFTATFDWYFDLPCQGKGNIDMVFNDFVWTGFIVPVGALNEAGMAAVELDDPLGYFGGTSADFEAWLLAEVAPRLPADAEYLLFAQNQAKPDWNNSNMGGWDPNEGILTETIVATAIPEPATLALAAAGLAGIALRRRRTA